MTEPEKRRKWRRGAKTSRQSIRVDDDTWDDLQSFVEDQERRGVKTSRNNEINLAIDKHLKAAKRRKR